jgi:excinuclease UvrABC nuclease subunit
VPRSVPPSKKPTEHGDSFYRVSVSVIETDDYEKRVETAAQVLSDNQAELVGALKKAIEEAAK